MNSANKKAANTIRKSLKNTASKLEELLDVETKQNPAGTDSIDIREAMDSVYTAIRLLDAVID